MKLTVGLKIAGGFFLAIVIMVVIGVSSYTSLNTLVEASYWKDHTYEVLGDLEKLLSLLKDAETGQRGFIITGEKRYLDPYNATLNQIFDDIKDIKELTADNDNQQRRIDQIQKKVSEKLTELRETISLRETAGFEAAKAVVLTDKGKIVMDEIRDVIDDMIHEEQTLMKIRASKVDESTENAKNVIVGGIIIALILLTIASFTITRNIANPLALVTSVASQAAAGDLRSNIPLIERSDEVGTLTKAFRQMVENLRENIAEITEGVELLGSSANEILVGTTQVASSTAETATAISETSTTVEEVRQAARLSSEKAQGVANDSQRVAEVALSGRNSVDQTAEGMFHIREQMESIAQTIVRLSEQSQSIGGIIASVTDLADQSNLLAVNAAIEAARAGEHGKGFAVVAQEIKSLSEQSKQSTLQVREILNDIQKATSMAVMATEQGSKAVETGVKQAAEAGEAIRLLADSTDEAAETAMQIVTSSQQQVVGMDQIGVAMEDVNQAGAQTAASMKQAEISAKNLHELGLKIKSLVEKYQI